MKYSHCFTLTVMICVLVSGHGLVQSLKRDLSHVNQPKRVAVNAAERYLDLDIDLHDTIRSRSSRLLPAYVRQFQQSRDTPRTVGITDSEIQGKGRGSRSSSRSRSSLMSSLLLRGAPIAQWHKDSNKMSAPFRWVSCGGSQQIMDVKSFDVKPDPLEFPGQISFSFDIEFHESISSSENVTIALDAYMKSEDEWLKIPCLGPVGSCTYVDFCQVIAGNTCPPKFTQEGVPCKCPFNQGQYKLNDFAVEIDAEVLVANDYKAKIQVSSDRKGNIGCYEVYFTVD